MLGFVQGAYSTEVLRAAIQAIPIGQIEAASAYGMSPFLAFRRITLPALLPFAIPGLANLWLNATKDTSLIAVVGYTELTLATRQAAGNTKMYFLFYMTAAAIYLIITLISKRASPGLSNECAWASGGQGELSHVLRYPQADRKVYRSHAAGAHRHWLALLAVLRREMGRGFRLTLPLLLKGLWLTLLLLVLSVVLGFVLAVPIGLVQVTGPPWLAAIARGFCTVIRGTPLLVQLLLIYYGLGSLFPQIGLAYPGFKENFMWPIRLDGFYYAVLAFTLSFAGYEGEIMRGAFLGVPRGELEAARAYGMSPYKVVTRVWLPRAVRLVLPTLAGETVLQLQSTPLAFTITVMDLMGVDIEGPSGPADHLRAADVPGRDLHVPDIPDRLCLQPRREDGAAEAMIEDILKTHLAELTAIRHDLHAHPGNAVPGSADRRHRGEGIDSGWGSRWPPASPRPESSVH